MERIVKAVNDLEQAFRELYGVEVKISLTVFDRARNEKVQTNRELAERIVREVYAAVFKNDSLLHTYFYHDKNEYTAFVGKFVGGTFDITVHYPLTEYTKETK